MSKWYQVSVEIDSNNYKKPFESNIHEIVYYRYNSAYDVSQEYEGKINSIYEWLIKHTQYRYKIAIGYMVGYKIKNSNQYSISTRIRINDTLLIMVKFKNKEEATHFKMVWG